MRNSLVIIGILILISIIINIFKWAFQNFIAIIGISLVIWGLYEWNKNRKLEAKSKVPAIIVSIGLVLTIGWFGSNSSTVEQATNIESTSNAEKQEQLALIQSEVREIDNSKPQQVDKQNETIQTEQDSVSKQNELASKFGLENVTVEKVVDGDIIVLSDGNKVRLIGVNTPESTTRTEEYGKEAVDYTKSELEGKTVYLQKDVSDTDQYDRLLRIIWLEVPNELMNEEEIRTKMFNAKLVLNGYAEPSNSPPDVTYSEYFVKFAREARENEVGLWIFGEDGTTKGDLDTEQNSDKSSTTKTQTETEVPPTPQYESYQNCKALNAVYPSGVSSEHPAYASKHDRDKDGWACEK